MSMRVGTQILTKLGSTESRIPLAAKDIFNSAGYTYFSYDAGGLVEGKDRFVDEVGTGLIWLFGIPAYKKLIDKTLFKKAGISPDVDVRIVKNQDYFKKAVENAPTEKIKNELLKAGENIPKTKAFTLLKFGASLALTLLSYYALTKYKQSMTKKSIEKEYMSKMEEKNNSPEPIIKDKNPLPIFEEFTNPKSGSKPSFGSAGVIKAAEEFMLNPIKNMLILDAGISTSRLKNARTKGEFQEYAIKEGSFLFFVYGADKLIKKGINGLAKKIKHPINLEADFLSTKLAEKVLTDKNISNEIKSTAKTLIEETDSSKIYDFIFKNPDNPIVEAAKHSGIISSIKDGAGKTAIDTRKFIDPDRMKNLSKDLIDYIDFSKNYSDKIKYLNKIKGLKVAATILNVAICCFALGYTVPKFIYNMRKKNQNGQYDFHVRKEIEKELAQKQQEKTVKTA